MQPHSKVLQLWEIALYHALYLEYIQTQDIGF